MDFIEAEKKYIKEITELQALRDVGNITESEYQELVYDLLDVSKIEQNLKVEQVKVAAAKLIKAMSLFAGVIPK